MAVARHTDRPLVSASARAAFTTHMQSLLTAGRRPDGLDLWDQVFEVVHKPYPMGEILDVPSMPPTRTWGCQGCMREGGGFYFPWIGPWCYRRTMVTRARNQVKLGRTFTTAKSGWTCCWWPCSIWLGAPRLLPSHLGPGAISNQSLDVPVFMKFNGWPWVDHWFREWKQLGADAQGRVGICFHPRATRPLAWRRLAVSYTFEQMERRCACASTKAPERAIPCRTALSRLQQLREALDGGDPSARTVRRPMALKDQ